jgi:hypothetical protein
MKMTMAGASALRQHFGLERCRIQASLDPHGHSLLSEMRIQHLNVAANGDIKVAKESCRAVALVMVGTKAEELLTHGS